MMGISAINWLSVDRTAGKTFSGFSVQLVGFRTARLMTLSCCCHDLFGGGVMVVVVGGGAVNWLVEAE